MDEADGSSEEVQELLAATTLQADAGQQQNQVAISPKRDIVRSTAVVKWSDARFPVEFSQLSMNTNLNDAPDNWPRSDSREERHLRDLAWQRQHSECSSFAMAHCYPDYAGEVDVVSEAENIKRLLKMPYDDSHASLIVHRVGRTLLLDNFDIHKHLLRKESENWTWLREFFKSTVIKSEDEMKYVARQVPSQAVQQKRIMYSKFLYKSLVGQGGWSEVEVSQMDPHHISPSTSPSPVVKHCVADRLPAIDQVKFGEDGEFRRQTLWTFEHLRMLIGTDLPVFSVGDHPCVSVRLRESSQPINVVTGLDYWLDNLMCNVPEVVMCYHDQGFVQKYELIKTEDIPKIPNSGFDPHEVKDIATNILSFLRNSATREGHTYWLYKCQRSDVVKLYDLTTLCEDTKVPAPSSPLTPHTPSTNPSTTPTQGLNPGNPFTIPVAMLLYRVGRKMHLSGRRASQVPQVKALLTTCLRLLDHSQHAEVCTSSYYLLSDLYIPDSCLKGVWVDAEDLAESSVEEYEEEGPGSEGMEGSERSEFSVSVKDLMEAPTQELQAARRAHLEGISGTPDERCKDGLQCIRKGLSCLERDLQLKTMCSQRSSTSIVEEQATAKASEAIPLRYESLQPKELMAKSTQLVQRSTVRMEGGVEDGWHRLSKALLLRKASMANYILATELLANGQPGPALKHIRYAVHCFESMVVLKPAKKGENQSLLLLILKTTSELRHLLATNGSFEEQQRSYDDMSEDDTFILDSAQSVLATPGIDWVYKWTTNRGENLCMAIQCLEMIRDLARPMPQTVALRELLKDVAKKMGAICNELGKLAMTQAENLLKDGGKFADLESVWTMSMKRFEQGLQSFHKVKDGRNEAFILLNIIRLHRIAFHAHMKSISDDDDRSKEQQTCGAMQHHFDEACECFKQSLHKVEGSQHLLRNNILWDWSSTYLMYGLHLQHNPPRCMDRAKVLSEVAELYRRAMKTCQRMEITANDPLWFSCKDRLASLEYSLAEMHVVSYCLQSTAARASKVFQQAEASYKRATELFLQARMYYKMLQVQCKRLAFYFRNCSDKEVPDMGETIVGMFAECGPPLKEVQGSDLDSVDRLQGDAEDPQVMLEYLLKPVLSACQVLLKKATQGGKVEAQQRVKQVYRRGLELQNTLKDHEATIQHKVSAMVDFIAFVKQHLTQPPAL